MNKPRTVYFSENFVCLRNIKQMGNAVHLFLNLLSVADDNGRVKTSVSEMNSFWNYPSSTLRRHLNRLRNHEYVAVQGRGIITIVIHPDYIIPPELREEEDFL